MEEKAAVKAYFNSNKQAQKTYFNDILTRITIKPGLKCVDIGCGTGNAAGHLASIVGESGQVIAIDPDESRLKQAMEMHQKHKNLTFLHEKSIGFPFLNDGYDVVLSNAVIHWIPTAEKVVTFRRVYESLKEDGIFAAAICRETPANSVKLINFCAIDVQNQYYSTFYPETSDYYKETFEKVGFTILEMKNVEYDISFDDEVKYAEFLDACILNGKMKLMNSYRNNEISFEKFPDGRIKHQTKYIRVILKK